MHLNTMTWIALMPIHNAGFAQELSTCTVNTTVGSTLVDVFATMADT
jgi:hypothetical protein